MIKSPQLLVIVFWPIDRFIFYARNPRKNDAAVDRMCASIREFGFKIPCLARSDGTLVDGHLKIKAARKLGSWPGGDTTCIPVILCEEWTEAQVKAFRLMVNRSVTWADWDDELLALELQELNEADFDLSLTGFDPKEIDDLLLLPEDDDQANAVPPVPENPVSRRGDLWICGKHRVLCGDATSAENVTRLLGEREPILMVTDPPYGIELDSALRFLSAFGFAGSTSGLAGSPKLWMRSQIRTMAVLASFSFLTGFSPAKLFRIATRGSAGQDAANSASSCWLLKASKGVAVVAAASSGVANATISFCSLMVKVAIIVLLGATLCAVITWITLKCLKSKAILQ